MAKPGRREQAAETMRQVIRRPDVAEKLAQHLTGPGNPFLDPAVRARGQATSAARGWPSLRGGNGTGLTVPQAVLLAALGSGWEAEYPVKGWGRLPGYPACYKLDLAQSETMTGIEVHGKGHGQVHGHGSPKDQKKRQFLESRGWTIAWIWNEEILTNLSGTLRRLRETTLPTESSSTTVTG
jgi:hypothetical protein